MIADLCIPDEPPQFHLPICNANSGKILLTYSLMENKFNASDCNDTSARNKVFYLREFW